MTQTFEHRIGKETILVKCSDRFKVDKTSIFVGLEKDSSFDIYTFCKKVKEAVDAKMVVHKYIKTRKTYEVIVV